MDKDQRKAAGLLVGLGCFLRLNSDNFLALALVAFSLWASAAVTVELFT